MAEWLIGGGDLGDQIRSRDWSATPLGPREAWPTSLRTALNMVLGAAFPMSLLWGPDLLRFHNDAARPILGAREPGLGRPIREVLPEVWGDLAPIFQAVLERGESIFLEDRLFPLERGGRLEDAYFTVSYSPVRCEEERRICGVLVVMKETTAALRSLRGLRDREAMLRTVLENSRDGINMLDLRTGRYAFMSPADVELTGFTTEEMNGLSAEEALARVHPEDRAIAVEQHRRIAAGEDPGPELVEYRWRVKSGEYRWLSDHRRMIRDEAGEPLAVVGVSRDITEHKAAEAALQRANERLAEAVEEAEARSASLRASEERLRLVIEELAEANAAKSRFLAILSHELRNPLTPIEMGLEILTQTPSADQAARARAIIGRQVSRLGRLVDDLLDLTRIQSGKVDLSPTHVDLGELMAQAIEDHRAIFERGGVTIELRPVEAPVHAHVDRERIGQVFGNLLRNAAKYTPRGGHTSVRVARDEVSDEAILEVVDDGVGLDAALLPRIFEPFVQADRSLDRAGGGLGLGLALVREVVELHGGAVEARSAGLGRGAAFTVRLPRSSLRGPAEDGPRRIEARRGVRVLVIEDSPDIASILEEALQLDDHVVAVAHDGPTGISLAQAQRPELVLCDLGLPGMSGYEVARALRGDPATRGSRLFALTGYALDEDVERALAAGFDAHLSKPVSLARLRAAIGEATDSRGRDAQRTEGSTPRRSRA